METLLRLYSALPSFKGKNYIAQKILEHVSLPDRAVQTMSPGFQMELFLKDRMQRWMFVKRSHEPETEVVLKKYLRQAKVFVDVGANIGYFSLFAKATNPDLQVYAFEPFPSNAQALRNNIALNNMGGVEVIEKCLSDQAGQTQFMVPPDEECGWGRIAYRDIFSDKKIDREVTTLDLFVDNKLRVDVLKIDVEGFEMKVLEGAKTLLSVQKPIICFEANEPCLVDLGTSTAKLFEFLSQFGYKIYAVHRAPQLVEVKTPIENYEWANYFALPNT